LGCVGGDQATPIKPCSFGLGSTSTLNDEEEQLPSKREVDDGDSCAQKQRDETPASDIATHTSASDAAPVFPSFRTSLLRCSPCRGGSSNACAFEMRAAKIPLAHTSTRPDRQEWIWLKHSATFWPAMAFEIGIQFLVATGAIAGDVLRSCWCYALSSLFHLIPVPADPFALPYNWLSDPLRCPLTIQLDSTTLTAEMDVESLKAMQVEIVKKFGFIPMACEAHKPVRQLIHLSGGMFVLIAEAGSFQWAWNYMLSKRYRSHECAADEAFQDRMLADFRSFCANEESRLTSFIVQYESKRDKVRFATG
jgi:hypothetical protein